MNIVFLGYPGSGKGTQARFIAQKLGMVHFAPGDILWDEVVKKTPLGMEVHDYLSSGRLVPDWLILRLLKDKFAAEKRGILFDGFPRTLEQAEALDAWLSSRSAALSAVIYFNLPEAAAAKRLEGRVACAGCGASYTAPAGAPLSACSACGGALKRRDDDVPAIIQKRMMVYRDQTEQLISYYKSNDILVEVKADQPQQAVTVQVATALKSVL